MLRPSFSYCESLTHLEDSLTSSTKTAAYDSKISERRLSHSIARRQGRCLYQTSQSMPHSIGAQAIFGSMASFPTYRQKQEKQKCAIRVHDSGLLQEDESSVQKSIVSPKKELELEFLISLQRAEGFWGLDVLQLLNFVPPFISYHIKQICATVCALAYMEIKFPSRQDEWELVAKKAEAWLECQKLPNEVSLDELKKEASDYIINNLLK